MIYLKQDGSREADLWQVFPGFGEQNPISPAGPLFGTSNSGSDVGDGIRVESNGSGASTAAPSYPEIPTT